MQNSVANASGMVAPVVTGYLVQQTGNYSMALLVSAFVGLVGLVAWLIVLPPVQPIDWSADSAHSTFGVQQHSSRRVGESDAGC